MRIKKMSRLTKETKIQLELNLDGTGTYDVETGCGFFDHMLELFARHGRFDMTIECKGDTYIDYHHTVEDIGILIGSTFKECLGDKKGITRYGDIILPMDEALIMCAVDISGRGVLVFDVDIPKEKVGDFDTELVKEFMNAMVREMGITLHIRMLTGENTHHIIEAIFKGLARALKEACTIQEEYAEEIPSTKGVL